MIKFTTTVTICILFLGFNLHAQQVKFMQQGEIIFEKKVNMFALLKTAINKENEAYMQKYYDQYKASQPQFVIAKSLLSFSKDQSLFKALEDGDTPPQNSFSDFAGVAQINVVHHNFISNVSAIQKKVFEETFLLKDSTRKIKWKLTDEKREIAGYQCRRANAIVMDSIYTVAFYTDEIAVPGGPESFTGLPGMILGIALPHDHISWFATKVTDKIVEDKNLQVPIKGKLVDNASLKEVLQKAFKQWGQQAQRYFKFFML